MDFDLTPTQVLVRDSVAAWAERIIAPRVREYSRAGRFPRDVLDELAKQGLFAGILPEEYGGSEMDYLSHGLVAEELSRVCNVVRSFYNVHTSLATLAVLGFGTEAQKRRYLPELAALRKIGCFCLTEPNSGSDSASLQTQAVRKGDRWVLRGTKMWITNGTVADLAIVFARTPAAGGESRVTAFLVDLPAPGLERREIHGKLGMWAASTAEVYLTDVEVGDDAVLGEVGHGMRVALAALDHGRYTTAAGCVGIARACIDAAKRYALERTQFGRPIASFQLVQEAIADMVTEMEAARYLVYRAGFLKQQGRRNSREVSIAKYYASEMALRVASRALQVHGSYGYSDEYPVERHFRDARLNLIVEGTSEMQKLIIGSHELGLRAFV
ncbi:MAG: acyl-CoA dehydrogenase family protein [Candidatus Rokubacteria bacterium]|nr:acyl-CoA dehydrogenase family protein [Candidatus Rokubacteria bacterium]